ncbi:MAG TPA: rhomboid family intramembrane serine protease [Gammaproteobacteria bacterium]|nr:rhomboid family intramembrane serine protease [Gammaproteobacteria bacterium]
MVRNLPPPAGKESTAIAESRRRFELAFGISFWFTATLWWIELVQKIGGWNLSGLGIEPHVLFGLIGVVTAPLLHGSWEHLLSNTLPLVILGTALLYGYQRASRYVVPLVWLGSGLGVWFTGQPAFYVGASGVVMGFIAFLLVAGALRRDRTSIAITCVVAFLYGTALVEIVPQGEPHIAYVAHAWGGAIGLLCAIVLFRLDPIPPRKRFHWQDEPEDFDDPVIGDLWREPPPAKVAPPPPPPRLPAPTDRDDPPRLH